MQKKLIFFAIISLLSLPAFADEVVLSGDELSPDNPLPDVFVNFEFARTYPISFSRRVFRDGGDYPLIGYRHLIGDKWLLGVFAQFKILVQREPDEVVPIFTIGQESMRMFRLYFPTYLAIGPRFLYLTPTTRTLLPLAQNQDHKPEYGAALSIALLHFVERDYMFSLRFDRWRGTGSMNYHGVETSVGMAVAI